MNGSAPCNSVILTAKALGIDLNLKSVNLMNKEHLNPDYVKINPQHTVPTLNDNGFYLWESRSIITYLVEKYGKGSTLIPSDPQQHAIMNQRLYFDMTLYQKLADYYYPQIMAKQPADPEKFKKMEEAVGFLNTFLEGKKYSVGDSLTLADFSLISSILTFEFMGFDFDKYPNIVRWSKLCKSTLKGIEEIQKSLQEIKESMKK